MGLVDQTGLVGSQRVLVNLLRESPNPEIHLAQLPFRMRKKIEPYVMGDGAKLSFDINSVKRIVTQIEDHLKRLTAMPVSGNDWNNGESGWIPVENTPFKEE